MSGETNDALFASLGDDELRQELQKHGMQAGPITPSTRRIYEIKLMKFVQNTGSNGVEEFAEKVATPQKNGPNGDSNGLNGVHEKSPEPTPISVRGVSPPPPQVNKPVPELDFSKDHDSSDEDEEESARILTPEEAARFRSNIQRTSGSFRGRYLNGEVATSTPMHNVSMRKAKGDYNYTSIAKIALLLFALAFVAVLFYNGTWNWQYLRSLQKAYLNANKSMNADDEL
ncbi:LEM domain-containing protein [Ditylenchus destructor]|uniref:LEM domain-containing protein n=1 Tax=Ditylenchus destructor TaxID=166010 RepID=A0AAD4MWR4_9BILA|nr:LEM domain-containing protein [Ditylenchus destructor]